MVIFINLLFIGLLAGVISGLLGVGGGTITIPAMVIVLGLSQHSAQGVSLLVMIPIVMVGAYNYYKKGNLNLQVAFYMSIGAAVGSGVGSFLAISVPSHELKKIFSVFVIIVAIKIFSDVFSNKK